MKKCLYVGSFNPITKAHLKIALDLISEKIIDYLYFLPVNSKKDNLETIETRIKMIDLVKKDKMKVLNIYNYNKDGSFHYLILEKIKDDKNITHILMGSDLFLKFFKFDKHEEILKKYNLIIVKREDIEIENIIKDKYSCYMDKIQIINKMYHGSSSVARELLKNKDNIYLDSKVLEYIRENNLYN